MKLRLTAGLLACGLLSVGPAFSGTIGFEGVANGFGSIADYYNGGTDIPVSGTPSSGPNLGVHFGLDLAAVADPDHLTFAAIPGLGDSVMGVGGSGGDYAMTFATGSDHIAFQYSATADTMLSVAFTTGPAQLFTLLATNGGCDPSGPAFCSWTQATLDLAGRIATAMDFGATSGVAAFDNIDVTTVPLPAGVWLLGWGLGALGIARRRRARAA